MSTVVIGAGLAGLLAAVRLAQGGQRVTLLAKGTGGLPLSQGTVDILGYAPERVARPLDALASFVPGHPEHPYARFDPAFVGGAVAAFRDLIGPDLLVGDPAVNRQLPTAVGAIRPTALVPPGMTAGECRDGARFLIAGVRQLKDFHPALIARNLSRTTLPDGGRLRAREAVIDLPAREGEPDATGLTYARSLDDPGFRRRLASALAPHLGDDEAVGLPAIIGLDDPQAVADLAEQVGRAVFEIPLPPPSVPGMRLNRRLTALAKAAGVRIVPGSRVTGFEAVAGRVGSVTSAAAGRSRTYAADVFVLATGGFESGALAMDSYGAVTETVFGLPLAGLEGELVHGDYWGRPQPLFAAGVAVDDAMRPLAPGGNPVHSNLYAVGGILAGAIRWQEKSGDGIAIATATRAAEAILLRAGEAHA